MESGHDEFVNLHLVNHVYLVLMSLRHASSSR